MIISTYTAINVQTLNESIMEGELISVAIPLLTSSDIRNPETALEYDIKGYVDIILSKTSPKSMSVTKGGSADIMLLVTFVSHISEITETVIYIDPTSGKGLSIEQHYVTVNDKGETIRGIVNVNELVTYHPGGKVLIKNGETVPLVLTVNIPSDYPVGVEFLPIGAVGIESEFMLLCNVQVKVYA